MYLNLTERMYKGVGKYNIPEIEPIYELDIKEQDWTTFNYARGTRNGVKTDFDERYRQGVTFFLDDYQFESVWTHPNKYIKTFKNYGVMLAPDFSMYLDFPKSVQIYNHYRKHWLAKYWQEHGVKVVPSINWSDEESFDWCFDGEPRNSIVAVSNVGCMKNETYRQNFMKGYNKMLEVLQPSKVLMFCQKKDDYNGNVEYIHVDRFAHLRSK